MTKLLAALSLVAMSAALPAHASPTNDESLTARRPHLLVCSSRNLNQRVFRAVGMNYANTQARALGNCYRASRLLLKGTCIPTGCYRR